jgi:hypothetical protein
MSPQMRQKPRTAHDNCKHTMHMRNKAMACLESKSCMQCCGSYTTLPSSIACQHTQAVLAESRCNNCASTHTNHLSTHTRMMTGQSTGRRSAA